MGVTYCLWNKINFSTGHKGQSGERGKEMTIEDFSKLAKARFDYCYQLLTTTKHAEYTRDWDKLYNFKRAGEMLRCSPERALLGMWIKHVVSLIDIIEDLDKGILPTSELLNEKLTDVIDYPALLEGLLAERMGKTIADEMIKVKDGTGIKVSTTPFIEQLKSVIEKNKTASPPELIVGLGIK